MKRREKDEQPEARIALETVPNTKLAANLFATMLRSVEMARERKQREAGANGRTEPDPAE